MLSPEIIKGYLLLAIVLVAAFVIAIKLVLRKNETNN